ncbi:MAG: hypothetical protein H7308_05440 [Chthonomonadaceae bacterium]|nr:hypothetical protein [Chthonomonadaceae bacterium]
MSFAYTLYNSALLAVSPLVGAYLAQRYFSGKSRPGWRERWGHLPEAIKWMPDSRPRLWFHAVSAGEVVAAVPILSEVRKRLPEFDIFLSVLTPAGHEMAQQQATPYIDGLFYFPFDLPWVVKRVVRALRPKVFVALESEMWPNLLYHLKKAGAFTLTVNGRISDKNFRRSQKWGGALQRWMLSNIDCLMMQSAMDAERIRTLGNLREPGRVTVVGNSKFDQEVHRLTGAEVQRLRRELNLDLRSPIFIAGSTRSNEEEREVLRAYEIVLESFPNLSLIIAPRQLERASETVANMISFGLNPVLRTQPQNVESLPTQHLVLDTMGELANVYAVADIAFVGNSFPPVVKGGGQNLLQPLAHGKPVLFGPLTSTIRSEVALVTEAQVGQVVNTGEELAEALLNLLRKPLLRKEIEGHALDLISANRGVSAKYADAITEVAHRAPYKRITANTPHPLSVERDKP